ncbi:putative periplasmic or secreted lipoprotein [Variovorax sp. PBS-H4]|uniref:BON domain-containing protein n=1 Tax=Variovorax sp. PBS-H4 TaxID=434008 RepID=UPI00131867F3|nr:BON domain-containing protein [Variovorax sp. PBS-H4]VTU18692.1 putative periplasmic or secreted lipoprotein [Variovorax sp. PBS-H4]
MPSRLRRGASVALLAIACAAASAGPEKKNWFDDPFFQVSSGARGCPVPEGPLYTAEERRSQMHARLERGTSCWLEGRCKDSNAFRYDIAIAPQVQAALSAVPGVRSASVWAVVQRRWVYLQGCVPSRTLARRLEKAARAVPDVELVVDDLMIGTRGKPSYPVAGP